MDKSGEKDTTDISSSSSFRNPKISDFWHQKYREDLGKNWNLFYKRNETRFFRDRHWIPQEFPELLHADLNLFEVGCGVGNFSFPLAELNPEIRMMGCDISPRAVELFKENAAYEPDRFKIFVADITKDDLSLYANEFINIATCIFVLSALPPETIPFVIKNVWRTLKPNGSWFIRDYSSSDAAQHRFNTATSQLSNRLFVRQDGTLAYYFEPNELVDLVTKEGLFVVKEIKEIKSRTRNVKSGIDLERSFIQLKLMKLN